MKAQIAQEVLRLLEDNKIYARRGRYLVVDTCIDTEISSINQLRSILSSEDCEVCALGALFCGLLNVDTESTTIQQYYMTYSVPRNIFMELLLKYFTNEELVEIERLFEVDYVHQYETAKDALKALMSRIIKQEEHEELHRNR